MEKQNKTEQNETKNLQGTQVDKTLHNPTTITTTTTLDLSLSLVISFCQIRIRFNFHLHNKVDNTLYNALNNNHHHHHGP
jgi:hypothetical protein